MSSVRPSDAPDFATLYADGVVGPRMAARLWAVAVQIHDAFREGMEDLWIDQLPTVAQAYADEQFVAAFGSRFEALADRLAQGLASPIHLTTWTASIPGT